jgi:hypothetical protein
MQNKDEKHLPWILCCGLDMFLKQLDQFMLQYYSFKAENIAKQQKCWELWQYAWRHVFQQGWVNDVTEFPIQNFILQSMIDHAMTSFMHFSEEYQIMITRKER